MYMFKKNILYNLSLSFVMLSMPCMALAAAGDDIGTSISFFNKVFGAFIVMFLSFAVVYFLWGVATYILQGDNEEKRSEGRQMMIYGIISIFVMVSIWGLVGFLVSSASLNNALPIQPIIPA